MAKQQTEDELNLRRKARRRLIGAIAFTLAVVVVLPMVLDSEPKPAGKDIDLRIPAPDKVGEFVPGVAASEVAEISPLADSGVVAASASASASHVVAQTDIEEQQATAPNNQPVATSNSKTEVQGKIQQAANKQPESKAQEAKKTESKGSESINTGKASSVESYVAQVGAYSNAAAAKQELDRLKKWGFKAYTEKVGDKIRVRVGPYAEREKAEKARQLLEKHGLHPVVTSDK